MHHPDPWETSAPPATAVPPVRPRPPRRTTLLGGLLAGIVLLALAAVFAVSNSGPAEQGLVFVIPAGSWQRVAQPTLDSAIAIPTKIEFGPNDVPVITIRNEDRIAHRAGPWVVDAGQTYTLRFPKAGEYQIACSVNPLESVTVTVVR